MSSEIDPQVQYLIDAIVNEPMRQIVSTKDTLGGKWRLDGHRISVAQLRYLLNYEKEDPGYIEREYPHLNLTAEERSAIKAWTFPPILDAPSFDTFMEFSPRCRCGEWMHLPMVEDATHATITCDACGRRYDLTLTEVIPDDH